MTKGRDDRYLVNSNSDLTDGINQLINNSDLSSANIRQILQDFLKKLPLQDTFPLSIITKKLTVLESIVKYLKEDKNYTLSRIAQILGRNQRNLWHTYNNAQKKLSTRFQIKESDILVPLDIFLQQTSLSPSEAVVVYLKEQRQLSLHQIATMLHRDDRTVWTTYNRAKKKHAKT